MRVMGIQGDYRFSRSAEETLVWRFDGRQWRRVKRNLPDHIQLAISGPLLGTPYQMDWEPIDPNPPK